MYKRTTEFNKQKSNILYHDDIHLTCVYIDIRVYSTLFLHQFLYSITNRTKYHWFYLGCCGFYFLLIQIYSSSTIEARGLRNLTFPYGELRGGIPSDYGKPLLPFSNGSPIDCRRDHSESAIDCFLAGDIRANEQVRDDQNKSIL